MGSKTFSGILSTLQASIHQIGLISDLGLVS